jgi:hypothetical protein
MRSLAQATPPIDLSGVGMPGCFGYAELPCDATVYAVPAASVQIGEPIPNVTALVGVTLVGQALAYFPGITPVGLVSSNGMVLTVGL